MERREEKEEKWDYGTRTRVFRTDHRSRKSRMIGRYKKRKRKKKKISEKVEGRKL